MCDGIYLIFRLEFNFWFKKKMQVLYTERCSEDYIKDHL